MWETHLLLQNHPPLSASPPTHWLFWCYKQTPSEAGSASARLKISAQLLLSIPRKDLTQGNTLLDFFLKKEAKKMYFPNQATKYRVAKHIEHYSKGIKPTKSISQIAEINTYWLFGENHDGY